MNVLIIIFGLTNLVVRGWGLKVLFNWFLAAIFAVEPMTFLEGVGAVLVFKVFQSLTTADARRMYLQSKNKELSDEHDSFMLATMAMNIGGTIFIVGLGFLFKIILG